MRSSMPPWPGMQLPGVLHAEARLISDSTRSPIGPITPAGSADQQAVASVSQGTNVARAPSMTPQARQHPADGPLHRLGGRHRRVELVPPERRAPRSRRPVSLLNVTRDGEHHPGAARGARRAA